MPLYILSTKKKINELIEHGTQVQINLKKSDHNLITMRKDLMQNLFDLKNKSSINQQLFNGGVAQLVRARDS